MAEPKMRIAFDSYAEVLSLKKLKKSKFQRNKHPQEQIERLALIMREHGVRHPIHISKLTGQVCFGHGRWEAAKLNGWTEFPVVYQQFNNEDEEYACVQSDNAIAHWAELDLSAINTDLANLGPDFDIDLLGIKDFVLEPAEKLEPGCDEDDVPEQADTRVKRGDVWRLGKHRLMCGDSTAITDVEKLMAGEKADLLYTDPPYGIEIVRGGTVGGGNVAKPGQYKEVHGDDSTDIARDVFHLATGLEIPTMCIWGGNYFTNFLPPKMGWIVWDKRGEMASNNFSDCELAWTNLDKAARIHKQTWAGMIREGERDKRVHPTQKPTALAEFCFDLLKATLILDLFGGSGSTLIACEKTNRKCFMMEIDPHYCDVILARWEKYTGQEAERIIDGESKQDTDTKEILTGEPKGHLGVGLSKRTKGKLRKNGKAMPNARG